MSSSDLDRLTRFVTERAAALALYARQWLDAAGADDAVQDALVALLGQRRAPDNPAAWLYRAVRNAAIDAARTNQRRRRREQVVALARVEWFDSSVEALIDARTAEQALRGLNPEHREVVVLRIWGELGYAEIAEVLELATSTVHDRYRAALGELRSVMESSCPANTNSTTTTR
jgi:RNA polymerase sigma-70 factor (ECF subfamily)